MRYSTLIASTKRMLSEQEAGSYVGVPALLGKMELAGWIKSIKPSAKIKLYDCNQLDKCCDRLVAGEYP